MPSRVVQFMSELQICFQIDGPKQSGTNSLCNMSKDKLVGNYLIDILFYLRKKQQCPFLNARVTAGGVSLTVELKRWHLKE